MTKIDPFNEFSNEYDHKIILCDNGSAVMKYRNERSVIETAVLDTLYRPIRVGSTVTNIENGKRVAGEVVAVNYIDGIIDIKGIGWKPACDWTVM